MWILNLFLYILWISDPQEYQEMKAQGYGCYVNTDAITGAYSLDREPPCWYDPVSSDRTKGPGPGAVAGVDK